jgi:ubiquinone/menaquinone biosynthesis C-methylase UbiE
MKTEEFNQERTKRYHLAMGKCPNARISELKELDLDRILKKENLSILDLGAGDGFLTRHLLKIFPKATIYALDSSESMLSKNIKINSINSDSHKIPLKESSIDLVISLATFHHVDKKDKTFKEINRILTQDGLFVIADVLDKTKTQEFFDTIVRKYCITGHNLSFLNKKKVEELAKNSKLLLKSSKLKNTPWKFDSRDDMALFVKNLLGLDISIDYLLKFLYENFPIKISSNEIYLNWQLGYHVFQKTKEAKK